MHISNILFLISISLLFLPSNCYHAFVQFTDIHVDPNLEEHDPDCRNSVLGTNYGCFTSWELLNFTFEAYGQLFKDKIEKYDVDIDFTLWTGDATWFYVGMPAEYNWPVVKEVAKMMFDSTPDGVPVYSTAGNHEYITAIDQWPRPSDPKIQSMFKTFVESWSSKIMDKDAIASLGVNGYYHTEPLGGLHVLNLNCDVS